MNEQCEQKILNIKQVEKQGNAKSSVNNILKYCSNQVVIWSRIEYNVSNKVPKGTLGTHDNCWGEN